MGVISGGNKIKKVLAELSKDATSQYVEVGFFEDAIYPDGLQVAQVAFWNEFGTLRSPSRPFFRFTLEQVQMKWKKIVADLLENHNYDVKSVLQEIGEEVKKDLQKNIKDWAEPPNAKSTIAAKGFNDPLIHTRRMMNSVDYRIKKSTDE